MFFSSHSPYESFTSTTVISGGGFNKLMMGSVKQKFEELILASSGKTTTLNLTKGSSAPIALYKEELLDGAPNSIILLLIHARKANFDVRRILVDYGSFFDIMYSYLFTTLQLDESHLTPYVGSHLQGFNDFPSIYQCIFGRLTLAELLVMPSTVHIKMKYYTAKGKVSILYGDIEEARRCFEASFKGLNSIKVAPRMRPSYHCPLVPRYTSHCRA